MTLIERIALRLGWVSACRVCDGLEKMDSYNSVLKVALGCEIFGKVYLELRERAELERLHGSRRMTALILWRHWWHGCAKFNRRWPHWRRNHEGNYPICKVCEGQGYWIYGYKNFRPDLVAQDIQGSQPSESDRYWAKHDGYGEAIGE